MSPDEPRRCPRCGGSQAEGYLADHAHGGRIVVPQWVEGAPEGGFLGLKTRDRDVLRVVTYRCTSCGLLESYARER